jgi:hypothetical protein
VPGGLGNCHSCLHTSQRKWNAVQSVELLSQSTWVSGDKHSGHWGPGTVRTYYRSKTTCGGGGGCPLLHTCEACAIWNSAALELVCTMQPCLGRLTGASSSCLRSSWRLDWQPPSSTLRAHAVPSSARIPTKRRGAPRRSNRVNPRDGLAAFRLPQPSPSDAPVSSAAAGSGSRFADGSTGPLVEPVPNAALKPARRPFLLPAGHR